MEWDLIRGKLCALIDKAIALFDVLIAVLLQYLHRGQPVHLRLALPTLHTKEGKHVANFPLSNDLVYTVPVVGVDQAGNDVALPAGDVVSASASDSTALGVVVGTSANGGPAVVLTPLKQNAPGITVTVTDSAGLTQDVATFDIGPGVPKALGLDFTDATTTSQPIPPS